MADGDRRLHQFRRLAEVGFAARRVDERVDFAATNDRSGEDRVAGFARGGQGFPGQRRLVDGYLVAVQQARVGRHDVAKAESDRVAGHEFTRRWGDPLAIAFHPGLDRERRLQGGDGVARLMFLPESDHGVGEKKNEDDGEIRPVLGRRRQDHRRFDHPGDRSPEIGEEFQDLVGLLLGDLVRTILSEPLLRLRLGQAVRRRGQFFLDLRQRQGLQVVLGDGLRLRLGVLSFELSLMSVHDRNPLCGCGAPLSRVFFGLLTSMSHLSAMIIGANDGATTGSETTHRLELWAPSPVKPFQTWQRQRYGGSGSRNLTDATCRDGLYEALAGPGATSPNAAASLRRRLGRG